MLNVITYVNYSFFDDFTADLSTQGYPYNIYYSVFKGGL